MRIYNNNAVVFFFNEQQPYIDRVSDDILAAKLKAYKKTKTGSSRLGLLERSTRTGSS